LLEALRETFHCVSVKDGCSPQGQCGCCTVWIDGAPRLACVTPLRRATGREVVTFEGVEPAFRDRWVRAFVDAGASQCGFCTPGILMRLMALPSDPLPDRDRICRSLAAHLCRCTGWQSIVEAAESVFGGTVDGEDRRPRDPVLASWRAEIEGSCMQSSGPSVVRGLGGFAADTAPRGSLVALCDEGTVTMASTHSAARRESGKVQGRRSGLGLRHPLELPVGDWALTLRTTWVEPAYLEPDASWCVPGQPAHSPIGNGGAFGGKVGSPLAAQAAELAESEGAPVLTVWTREEVARRGAKRPPIALGLRADETGILRVARTPGSADLAPLVEAVGAIAPGVAIDEVDVFGPPVSPALRAAGWAEVAAALGALNASRRGEIGPGVPVEVVGPDGARAVVRVDPDDAVTVDVWAGPELDATTLRSYCLGAVHQALGLVRSEGISVDEAGAVHDLTIRSFGVLAAAAMPTVTVTIHPTDGLALCGSDPVFAATAAAAWLVDGLTPAWPTRRGQR
jgi:xanthine dehydrogenase small subunit